MPLQLRHHSNNKQLNVSSYKNVLQRAHDIFYRNVTSTVPRQAQLLQLCHDSLYHHRLSYYSCATTAVPSQDQFYSCATTDSVIKPVPQQARHHRLSYYSCATTAVPPQAQFLQLCHDRLSYYICATTGSVFFTAVPQQAQLLNRCHHRLSCYSCATTGSVFTAVSRQAQLLQLCHDSFAITTTINS